MATSTPALEPLLTVAEVAAILKISKGSVYALHAAGQLPAISISVGTQRSRLRFRQADIARFIGEEPAGVTDEALKKFIDDTGGSNG